MIIRYDYEKLIRDMKQFEKDEKLTHKAFAQKSGVNVAIISRILNKDYRPGTNVVERITKTMGGTILDYSIEQVEIHTVKESMFNNMTIEQLDALINKLLKMRNDKIILEIEKLNMQKEEIISSITEYKEKLIKEIES